jgi:hypothetical protein
MKTWLRIVTVIVLLMMAGPTVFAANTPEIRLTTNKSSYALGEVVHVTIESKKTDDLYGVQFELVYDEEQLRFVDSSVQNVAWPNGYADFRTAPGVVKYVATKLGPVPGDSGKSEIVTLEFVTRSSGNATMMLKNIKAADDRSRLIPVNGEDAASFKIRK